MVGLIKERVQLNLNIVKSVDSNIKERSMHATALEGEMRQLDIFQESSAHQFDSSLYNHYPSKNIFGKSVIIVGPGEHFGLHLARKFSEEGFTVGLIARSEKNLSLIVSSLRSLGIYVHYACADVRDVDQLQIAFSSLLQNLPQLQCLIYNVKYSFKGSGLSLSSTKLTESFDINVSGAISTIQIALPILTSTKKSTHKSSITPTIILTGGGYKDNPHENKLSLSIGKTGIHTVFTTLRRLLSSRGITLKTLVIDGMVREYGNCLHSEDVAEEFWKVFTSPPNKHYFRCPERLNREIVPGQLRLPI